MDPSRPGGDPAAPAKAPTPDESSATSTRRVLDDVTRLINAGLLLRPLTPALRLRPTEQTPSVRRHALFGMGRVAMCALRPARQVR